jgi:epoxyqueuosine reductase
MAEDGPRLLRWVEEGRAGAMEYMVTSAARRAHPERVLEGVRSVVAVAMSHDPGRSPGIEPPLSDAADRPRGFIARFARGRDYHRVLATRLRRLKDAVLRLGGPGTEAWWSVDHGPVMDRVLARNAGLGFQGKSTSFIRPGLGSYFVLGEVLTNLDLPGEAPAAGSCGTCTRCLDVCPTKAFLGPYDLDPRRCISYLTIEQRGPIPVELRAAIGTMIFGCDLCQEVCPWNRFAAPAAVPDLRSRDDNDAPDLVALAAMDEAAWKERFRGSAVLRAGWSGFRRNLAVALGNSGRRDARPSLEALARCGDELVEEHARWGICRLDDTNRK